MDGAADDRYRAQITLPSSAHRNIVISTCTPVSTGVSVAEVIYATVGVLSTVAVSTVAVSTTATST
jgi:hypothetical protein